MAKPSASKKSKKETSTPKYPTLRLSRDVGPDPEKDWLSPSDILTTLVELKRVFSGALRWFEKKGADGWTKGYLAIPKGTVDENYGMAERSGYELPSSKIKCMCAIGAMQHVALADVDMLFDGTNIEYEDIMKFNDASNRKFPQIKTMFKRLIKDTDAAIVKAKKLVVQEKKLEKQAAKNPKYA